MSDPEFDVSELNLTGGVGTTAAAAATLVEVSLVATTLAAVSFLAAMVDSLAVLEVLLVSSSLRTELSFVGDLRSSAICSGVNCNNAKHLNPAMLIYVHTKMQLKAIVEFGVQVTN